MSKEGYQPLKTKKTIKIIPPNTGSNIQMKKDGYNWEDLDKAWWEGFDNAKSKMKKRIAELEAQIEKMQDDIDCLTFACENYREEMEKNLANATELEKENAELKGEADSILDNWCKGDDPCPHLKKRDEQLTKAKEIIRTLLLVADNKVSQMEFQLCVADAKQFISEVEK
jgi:chromosome segregation ATPase